MLNLFDAHIDSPLQRQLPLALRKLLLQILVLLLEPISLIHAQLELLIEHA